MSTEPFWQNVLSGCWAADRQNPGLFAGQQQLSGMQCRRILWLHCRYKLAHLSGWNSNLEVQRSQETNVLNYEMGLTSIKVRAHLVGNMCNETITFYLIGRLESSQKKAQLFFRSVFSKPKYPRLMQFPLCPRPPPPNLLIWFPMFFS